MQIELGVELVKNVSNLLGLRMTGVRLASGQDISGGFKALVIEANIDKGFYFEMPFSFLWTNAEKDVTKITIQPLTRDGGAKLKTNNPLIYSIISGSEGDYEFFLE